MKYVQLQVCRSKATSRLSVSSEMSELLQHTRLSYLSNLQSHRLILLTQDQAYPEVGTGTLERLKWARLDISHYSGARVQLGVHEKFLLYTDGT